MRIGQKLLMGYFAVALLFAVVGLYNFFTIKKINESIAFERATLKLGLKLSHSRDVLGQYLNEEDEKELFRLNKSFLALLDESKILLSAIASDRDTASYNVVVLEFSKKIQKLLVAYQGLAQEVMKLHNIKLANIKKLQQLQPLEKQLRHKVKDLVEVINDHKLLIATYAMMYNSKEALYQYQDVPHIEKWLESISELNSSSGHKMLQTALKDYLSVAKKSVFFVLETNKNTSFALLKMKELSTIISEMARVESGFNRAVNKIVGDIKRTTLTWTIVILVFAFVISIILGLLITRSIISPIMRLRDSSIEMGKGKWDVNLVINSSDEIGDLALAFNEMKNSLQIRTQEITAAKTYVENIINCMMDMLIVINPNGSIRSINHSVLETLKYSENDLIGSMFNKVFEQDYNWSDEKTRQSFIGHIETSFKAKDHAAVPVILSGSLLKDNAGNLEGIVYVVRDISEQKKAKQALIAAKEAADRANKLKSQFLANVSHEIRNPITGIVGMLQLLSVRADNLSEKQKFHIKTAHKNSYQLISIVNDIVDLSKIEAGGVEYTARPFCWNELILSVVDSFEKQLSEKNIIVKLVYSSGRENTRQYNLGDEQRIKQVLSNFVTNAIKFSDEEGRICIDVSINCSVDYLETTVKVIDNGCGVAADKIDLIWDSFVQEDSSLSRNYEGAGLGLSIAKKLIEGMAGQVWCTSEKTKGSTFAFKLVLPLVDKLQVEFETSKIRYINKNEKINALVVEDNYINLQLLKSMLEHLNLTCDTASDGVDALEKFKSRSYNIVFLDIMMPIMDGLECLKQIRKLDKTTPIVAVTAKAMDGDKQKYLDLGFTAYVAKPYTFETLSECLSILQ